MARRPLYIPDAVRDRMSGHIRQAVARAVREFESGHEDEDTLTGHLGARLQVGERRVRVTEAEVPGTWRWSIDYRKFRGRGKDAAEHLIGADGILELSVKHGRQGQHKSALFQSKVNGSLDETAIRQLVMLSNWREAAFLIEYAETGYTAVELDEALRAGLNRNPAVGIDLASFLIDRFIACTVGDDELLYRNHILQWRTEAGEVVGAKFNVGHRISFKVKAPFGGGAAIRRIQTDDVHKHRMSALPEDILSLDQQFTPDQLKTANRSMAMLYHPDKHSTADDLVLEILKRRMQDVNKAAEFLRKRGV
jgi:hypothetical protein